MGIFGFNRRDRRLSSDPKKVPLDDLISVQFSDVLRLGRCWTECPRIL